MRSTRGLVAGMAAAFALVSMVAGSASALGEKVDGFPSWAERVQLELANRARVDPQVEMTTCGSACSEAACYTPQPPLKYNRELGRAARYHSDEMGKQGFFDHPSHCTLVSDLPSLYPAQCDGSAACACVGGVSQCSPTCTDTSQRVQMFAGTYSGEIIASGGDPTSSFYLWLYENGGGSAACQFTMQNGHRWLILTSGAAVGFGASSYFVGDFGGGGETGKIASGTHWPQSGNSVQVHANWYDTAGPKTAMVNVDGECTPLSLERGSAANGTYWATLNSLGTACHRYFFVFTDAGDQLVTYPTTGSLGIGPSGSCEDWSTDRPSTGASCSCTPNCGSKVCGDDGCGGVCGNCGTGTECTGGQCVATGTGGAGGSTGGAGGSTGGTGGAGGSTGGTGGATGGAGGATGGTAGAGGATGGAGGATGGAAGAAQAPGWNAEEPSGCACMTSASQDSKLRMAMLAGLVLAGSRMRRRKGIQS